MASLDNLKAAVADLEHELAVAREAAIAKRRAADEATAEANDLERLVAGLQDRIRRGDTEIRPEHDLPHLELPPVELSSPSPFPFRSPSARAAVAQLFAESPDATWDLGQIESEFTRRGWATHLEHPRAAIGVAIGRLIKAGKVIRLTPGIYAATNGAITGGAVNGATEAPGIDPVGLERLEAQLSR